MPLQRGEVLGYDFNRMVVEFTRFNQGKTVRCAISTAATDDLEGKHDVKADQRLTRVVLREQFSDQQREQSHAQHEDERAVSRYNRIHLSKQFPSEPSGNQKWSEHHAGISRDRTSDGADRQEQAVTNT